MARAKTMVKRTVRKGARGAVKSGVAWAKWAAGYACAAALGGLVITMLDSIGITVPLEAGTVGTMVYFVATTVFLHRRLTPRRVAGMFYKANRHF